MLSLFWLLYAADGPVGVKSTPIPIKRPAPSVPMRSKWYADGPVICSVNMVISPEGKPSALEPVTDDDRCPKRFMKATLRRLKWWRFEPAMAGVAVEGAFQATLQYFATAEVVGADPRG